MNCKCNQKSCHMKKNPKCCWCMDKRNKKEKKLLYLDGFGKVDLTYLGIEIPIDIHYCPGCKITKTSTDKLLEEYTKELKQKIENESGDKIKSIYRKMHR